MSFRFALLRWLPESGGRPEMLQPARRVQIDLNQHLAPAHQLFFHPAGRRGAGFFLLHEFVQRRQQYFHVLDVTHHALVTTHGAAMVLRDGGQQGRQRLDHVTEALERNPCAVDGLGVVGPHVPAKLRDPGKRPIYGALDNRESLFAGDSFALEPDPLFKCRKTTAQTLRLDMFDGFACCPGEMGLAVPQPVVKRVRVRKGARHSPHVSQLDLRIAELVESVEVMLERAAGLPDVVFGNERAEQLDGREQPSGFHTRVMHGVLGKTLLAALQPFAITPPLRVQRIAKVLQHIGGLDGGDV